MNGIAPILAASLLLGTAAGTPPARTASPPAPPVSTAPVPVSVHTQIRRHLVRRARAWPSTGAIAAANHRATAEPAAAGFLNAVQVYAFADGALYKLYAAPERVTDIALQAGEALVAVASGDTVRWVIGDTSSGSGADRRTHILVKPFGPDLSTNLVITTDRRTYHLALVSTAGAAMAGLAWSYPQDDLVALRAAAAQAEAKAPVASGLRLDQLRFDYVVSGDTPPWRPLRAFDDGRQTFIEFPESLATGEAPPLFLVDGKGAAQLVNYRVQGRFYIVDRLFDVAELRLGTKPALTVRISRGAGERGKGRGA